MLGFLLSVVFGATELPITIENCQLNERFLLCDLTNTGSEAIAGVHFDVEATDIARTVPWVTPEGHRRFGAAISGGIEPGETIRHLLMMPQMPSRVNVETLILNLIDVTLEDVNGEPITK